MTAAFFPPAGPVAGHIAAQTAWLVAGAAVVWLGVMVLVWLALRRDGRRLHTRRWLVGGGLVLPLAVLTPAFVDSLRRSHALDTPPAGDELVVAVTAHAWWWELRYRDPQGGADIVGANELHLPVGRPVRLALASADVIHSVWVPALAGKMDIVPGRLQHLRLRADRAGVFLGPCAEYCGEQHARMTLRVVAQAPAEFDAWLAHRRAPAGNADAAVLQRGRAAFAASGCAVCHRIAGLSEGRHGPDLTHVGSRATLGAGRIDNDAAALRRWIAGVQSLKPGARMPSFDHLDDATLTALAGYLAALR